MRDTYGAVVIYGGESKSAFFECDICECKFKVRINEENQDGFRRTPVLRVYRQSIETAEGLTYTAIEFEAKCPCCGTETETRSTITEEEDEDV